MGVGPVCGFYWNQTTWFGANTAKQEGVKWCLYSKLPVFIHSQSVLVIPSGFARFVLVLLRIQRRRDSQPTPAVSGVYNAGWLGTGLGSRVFNRDTNVILDLTSWGNRTPVTDWFCQMPSVFCQSVTILVLSTNRTDHSSTRHKLIHSGNFIQTNQIYWGTAGNTTQAKHS